MASRPISWAIVRSVGAPLFAIGAAVTTIAGCSAPEYILPDASDSRLDGGMPKAGGESARPSLLGGPWGGSHTGAVSSELSGGGSSWRSTENADARFATLGLGGAQGHGERTAEGGVANCSSGTACINAHCSVGFGDCDGIIDNGCETTLLDDTAHCGTCQNACNVARATASCSGGRCVILRCSEGWTDCNALPEDGCETRTSNDPMNCGACGAVCSANNGSPYCSQGACAINCAEGFADCDKDPGNGCESSLLTSIRTCGDCSTRCNAPTNASPICRSGNCGLSTCIAPFGDCDANSTNGCESNIETDANNCGGCGIACSLQHAIGGCTAGSCSVLACDEGWADCNGVATDGCEANLLANASHCGACEVACSTAHGSHTCVQGNCAIASCETSFQDCNQLASDGCESNLRESVASCGGCGVTCSAAHGSPSCEGGGCKIACDSGYGDCDGNVDNGCEVDTMSDLKHCGACARPCDGECIDGTCVSTPCSGYCSSPTKFTIGSGAIYGIDKQICHESYDSGRPFTSGNCGNFAKGRHLYVNGVVVSCDVTTAAWDWTVQAKPEPRRGGYCFYDDKLGGNGASAWFNTW